ncbi:MAG TPA: ABC transporter permease [Rhizobiaceae bacterium]|nr:ABC transporter permease [Rhizobiaceae bacterium]
MIRYIFNRLLMMIPTLIGVALITFFILRIVPGDIVEVKMRADGAAVSVEAIEAERKRLGLDQPLGVQFVDWMKGLVTLDLGQSMWTGRPVSEEIAARFELTFEIAILATIFAVLVAVPLGTVSALWRGTWIDYTVRLITMGGLALPTFWVGLLLLMFLLWNFNWLPPITFTPFWRDPWANISQLIWPAMVVGYRFAAVLARLIRSSLLEILNEDFIRTARAKGASERKVVWVHALGNALLPAITVIGLEFAFLIGGLVVTEQVFNLNGIGKLFIQSIKFNDYTMIQGMVMMFAAIYVIANLVVDLLYAAIDPRVRYR